VSTTTVRSNRVPWCSCSDEVTIQWGEEELIDGRLIFGRCSQGKIHLYDTETGEAFQTVDAECHFTTMSVKISRDGSKVFRLARTSVRVWSVRTGEVVGNVGLVGKPLFNSLVVDGSRAWVHFEDSRVQGWDFGSTGPSTSPVQNIPEDWTAMDACTNMPAKIKGVNLRRPYRCAYVDGSPHIHGFWMVDWDEPDCKPRLQDVTDTVSLER